jgi:hypothetical protein
MMALAFGRQAVVAHQGGYGMHPLAALLPRLIKTAMHKIPFAMSIFLTARYILLPAQLVCIL